MLPAVDQFEQLATRWRPETARTALVPRDTGCRFWYAGTLDSHAGETDGTDLALGGPVSWQTRARPAR